MHDLAIRFGWSERTETDEQGVDSEGELMCN